MKKGRQEDKLKRERQNKENNEKKTKKAQRGDAKQALRRASASD